MKYQKNIKITVSKAEQEAITSFIGTLCELDTGNELSASDIFNVLDAITNKDEEAEVDTFDNIEIEYEE